MSTPDFRCAVCPARFQAAVVEAIAPPGSTITLVCAHCGAPHRREGDRLRRLTPTEEFRRRVEGAAYFDGPEETARAPAQATGRPVVISCPASRPNG